jgi:formylglycine-generating enzyme required for sulfatase activity
MRRVLISLLILMAVLVGCGDRGQAVGPVGESTSITIPLNKTAASEIASAELVITGEGFTSVTQELTVSGATISGVVERLLPGLNRTFTMNAYNAAGVLVYSGSTTVDIADGEQAQVSINLIRVDAPFAPVEMLHQLPDGTVMPMMLVPAGEFTRGSGDHPDPFQSVYVSEFYIGKLEVTLAQAARWLTVRGDDTFPDGIGLGPEHRFISDRQVSAARGLHAPEDAQLPVNGINWYGAREYCAWAGLRLPTEAEWEKAARGEDLRVFPWGNTIDSTRANFETFEPVDVGSFPSGASTYGALDMAGNVAEWVSDWFKVGHYYESDTDDPSGPPVSELDSNGNSLEARVIRGGHSRSGITGITTYQRLGDNWKWGIGDGIYGFRCARN